MIEAVEDTQEGRRRFQFYGAAADCLASDVLETLLDSGAGTGKSFVGMYKAHTLCNQHPGLRVLFARKTRKSLSESILPDFESQVLPPDHYAYRESRATRDHRDHYAYANGSRIVLGGLDNVDRVLSAQYDLIIVFQAEETTLEDWEKLMSRLRNGAGPYHQIIADVNPDRPDHWINKRFPKTHGEVLQGKVRLCFRHEDNPRWYDHENDRWHPEGELYVGSVLEALTGPRRERLLFHRWIAAEGLIYDQYDPATHLITAEQQFDKERRRLFLNVKDPWTGRIEIAWTFAVQDWGRVNAGCLQVWGVDKEGRLYRLSEVYQTQKDIAWWAERAVEACHEYDPRVFVCDHDDAAMSVYRSRISEYGSLANVVPCVKARPKLTGFSEVNEALRVKEDGFPSIFLLRDARRHGIDQALADRGKPTCLEEEILGLVYRDVEDGKPIKGREEEDPSCENHACDCTLYSVLWSRRKDLSQPIHEPEYEPGKAGDILGHAAKRRRHQQMLANWRK